MIVDGIDISRKYHFSEIMDLHNKGRLRPVAVAGYIVRADADGMISFVPSSESTLFRAERGKLKQHVSHDFVDTMREKLEHEHPIVRRRAQAKRISLVQRLMETAKQYGTIPGLTDEQISAMIGEPWTTGVSVVTAEMLDRISAYLLVQGEATNKEADSKRVTKAHATIH